MKFDTGKDIMVSDAFELIKVSKLSLDDKFMRHRPRTFDQRECKRMIEMVISKGVKDFYRPKFDPSFDCNGGGICFNPGNKPLTRKTYNWWEVAAKDFAPERGSRLGTELEYMGFIGVLLKKMVTQGWTVKDAWYAVCDDSRKLGHFCDSVGAKNDFELTGSREVCGFFDLANTYKILAKDSEGFYSLASGDYHERGEITSISDRGCSNLYDSWRNYGVGWIILEK